MRLCGKDGTEFRCCKTGMTMHDTNFHPDSRFQADLLFCPICGSTVIVRAEQEYFSCPMHQVHCVLDGNGNIKWDPQFIADIKARYGLTLTNKGTIA